MTPHEQDMTELVDRLRGRLENWAAESTKQAGEIGDLKRWLAEVETERDALKAAIAIGRLPGFAADVLALVDDYSDKEQSVIARLPFLATFDQLCFEKYGFSTDPPTALAVPESTEGAAMETASGDVRAFAADVARLVKDYAHEERGVIALTPFEATLDQLCLEKYGFDLDKIAASETTPAERTDRC